MEPERPNIEEIMRRFDLEEDEARAFYHLGEARSLMVAIFRDGAHDLVDVAESSAGATLSAAEQLALLESKVVQHFRALNRELAMRVLTRNYPGSWGQ